MCYFFTCITATVFGRWFIAHLLRPNLSNASSLTERLALVLERLALQRISPTVEGLLSPDQANFRKGRSTSDQIAALTTFIENGFQQNRKTGAVFLDLTAA